MKALFDTSTLVAAMVESHPHYRRAQPWLRRAVAGGLEFFVAAHSVAEVYAVLTALPVSPRISPATAARLIQDNLLEHATVVSLSAADYTDVVRRLAEQGVSGGAVYDALIARAAVKAEVDQLVTFNADDFRRVWPVGLSKITVP